VLVLNVGSSTLKVALFAPGGAERLWEASTQRSGALIPQLQRWLEPQLEPCWPHIQAAGHRLVHGGERFIGPTRVDAAVLEQLEALNPLERLVMASRSGSVDPGLLLHLQRQGLSLDALEQGLQEQSGLLGLSGLSGDWRELRQEAANGHAGAQLAVGVFLHQLRAGMGAMAASLGGVDQIALSGGIGAHDRQLLEELSGSMAWLGSVTWRQIAADEEGMIARLVSRADPAFGAAAG